MTALIVNKAIERRGKIGPLYIYEALFLGLVGMAYLLGIIFLHAWCNISQVWLLSCPAFLGLLFLGLLVCRKNSNPTYLSSLLAFYKQPKYMNTQSGTLCYKCKANQTI